MMRLVRTTGLSLLLAACGGPVSGTDAATDGPHSTVPLVRSTDFAESSADVRNPDRGFYWWDWNEASPLVLVKPRLDDYCGTATLPTSVLDDLRTQLGGHRDAGRRVILRFVYADGGCNVVGDNLNVCGRVDAESVEIIEGHIAQLAPLLQENADVIAYLEAGFLGMWGEWNSECAPGGASAAEDQDTRRRVVRAILDALPAGRHVLLRRPRFRDELPFDEADLDRIGFHNDCLFASDTDYGTYDGALSVEEWKSYIEEATVRVPIGGETCNDDPTYTSCSNAAPELERLRYTYVHEGYNADVIARWDSEGCLEDIRQRLGYRLVLRAVEAPVELPAGDILEVRLELDNVGFAPPYSTRRPMIVLRSGDQERTLTPTSMQGMDTRSWLPGATIHPSLIATLPSDLAAGTWEVRLALLEDVSDLPAYALVFANDARTLDDVRRENILASITVR